MIERSTSSDDIDMWPASRRYVTPEGDTVLRVFAVRPGEDPPPCVKSAEEMYERWIKHRVIPKIGPVSGVEGKPKRVFFGDGDGDDVVPNEKAAVALLSLLVSQADRIAADPCEAVRIRIKRPNDELDADMVMDGKTYKLTGLYGPDYKHESLITLTLFIAPNAEMYKDDETDRWMDYPRTLLHELGHGATVLSLGSSEELYGMMKNAAEQGDESARKIMDRAKFYKMAAQKHQEVAADAWLIQETCKTAWGVMIERFPEIEEALRSVRREHMEKFSESGKDGMPTAADLIRARLKETGPTRDF